MRSRFAPLAALALLLVAAPAAAVSLPIVVDGEYGDWTPASLVAVDGLGDDGSSGIDLDELYIANDQDYLYLRFQVTAEIEGEDNQQLRLYLDGDNNSGTGTSYAGLGADLVWDFGDRDGTIHGSFADWENFGLQMMPTISSTEFEIAIRRDTSFGGPLFSGSTIRLVLRDMAGGGDVLPNSGSISYSFDSTSQPNPSTDFVRDEPGDLRLVSWNLRQDNITAGGSTASAIDRIMPLVDGDLYIFNECWNSSANDVKSRLESLLGGIWHTKKDNFGTVIASRHAFLGEWVLPDPMDRSIAVLIDMPDVTWDTDVLVIGNHWKAGGGSSNEATRQEEADMLIEFIADAMSPGGVITLPQDTPIIAGGDLNLVSGSGAWYTTFTGDIADNGSFGPDTPPDWDGSLFDLAPSLHTHQRATWTYYNEASTFYPGLLDFLFYTGSVLELGNHYVVETLTMPGGALSTYGLNSGDSADASDHRPRVLDLRPVNTGTSAPGRIAAWAQLLPAAPNPFNPRTTLRYRLEAPAEVELAIADLRGRVVKRLEGGLRDAGEHRLVWDGTDRQGRAVASGAYHLVLRATRDGEQLVRTETLVLVR